MKRGTLVAAAVLVLLLMVGGTVAFEDTVQRYPTDAISDFWTWTGNTPSIANYPTAYPTSNTILLSFYDSSGTITPYDTMSPDYIALTVRSATSSQYYYFKYYNVAGVLISQFQIGSYFPSYHNGDLYEMIRSENNIILYINGVSQGSVCTVSTSHEEVYIEISYGSGGSFGSVYLDDFTSEGTIIGMNREWSEAVTYIDASYSVRSMFSFPTAVYDMRIQMVSTGETINTTVLPSNQSAGDKPCGFMRYNRNDLFGTNYGLYQATLNRDGTKLGETDFWYKYSIDLGSATWNKDSYSVGEPAVISYTLNSPDYGTYTYKIETMGTDGTVDDSWDISDSSGVKNVDLSNYDTGTEYVVFTRTDKTSGNVIEFAYDWATLTETVVIVGNTTNAITGEAMENVSVTFKQGTEWYNTTSAADGTYNLTDLSTGIQITCNANVTYDNYTQIVNETFNSSEYDTWVNLANDMVTSGSLLVSNTTDETPFIEATDYSIDYSGGRIMVLSTGSMINWTDYNIDYNTTETFNISTFSFTPLEAKAYTVDLYLFNVNQTFDNTTIYGLVGDTNYYQAIENATMNIGNSTWNSTTQTTATGYYAFHDLTSSSYYNVNASATGYISSDEYNVSTATTANRQDIQLQQLYTVTVRARDATTTAYINTYTAYFDTSENATTTGTATFTNVSYGTYSISAAADGYYPAATTEVIDKDTTVTLSLTRMDSEYYAPHYVKFKLVSVFGEMYSGVTTVVYTGATATGDEYASGTTGTDGAITFKLTENAQYTLTFTNTTQDIDETLTVYPKDTEYFIYIDSFSWSPPENQTIRDTADWWWTHERINLTYGWINFTYTDAANETASVNYWINSSNDTNIYSFNTTYPDSWTVSQIVPANNTTYIVHFSADHPRFDSLSGSMRSTISFGGKRVSFGWSEQWMYDTVAVCAIIFLGLLFSATSVNVGAVITALSGWMFMWMGWLSGTTVNYGMMVLATIIAVGFAMRKGEVMHT